MHYLIYILLIPVIVFAQLTPFHFKTVGGAPISYSDVAAITDSVINANVVSDTSALIYIASGSVTPNVTSSGVYVKVTGWSAGLLDGITFAGDSLKVSTAGDYILTLSVSLSGGVLSDVFLFRVAVNGTKQSSFQCRNDFFLAAIDKNSGGSFSAKLALVANSGVSIWVTNTAGTTDPTITNATVFLKKL